MEQGYQEMICDECGKNNANIHVTQITNNETTVSHLCEKCAAKKGISVHIDDSEYSRQQPEQEPEKSISCPVCSMDFSEFTRSGQLGCSACYRAFSKSIDNLLIQMHGTAEHKGKGIVKKNVRRRKVSVGSVKQLRSELEDAIKKEAFEQAAQLRDTINGILKKDTMAKGK